ncbi:MAG: CoA transferase [Chloroflexi bacterium]|nr:CoA transferase [Chloroflexota bacterium]
MTPRALDGVRVIDFSTTVAGAWCSRLLADFGAEVVLAEPPAGHPLRQLAPFDHAGASIPAAYFLANKRSVTLDLDSEAGRGVFRGLAARCDVLVSSAAPSWLATRGLEYGSFGRADLVMAHATEHGMAGALAETPGNDLTTAARSGWAALNGLLSREPLKPSGWQSSMCTGVAAWAAVLAALWRRGEHAGEGQEVDVAAVDVMASTFAPAVLRTLYGGETLRRRAEVDMLSGPVPVRDGHFALTISRAHFWRDAMHILGLEDLAADPRWEAGHYRASHKDEYVGRVEEAMRGWTRHDLFQELAARRVIAGPVLEMAELAANEHLQARGFWAQLDDGEAPATFPGAPFKMTRTPWELSGRAPAPGRAAEDGR